MASLLYTSWVDRDWCTYLGIRARAGRPVWRLAAYRPCGIIPLVNWASIDIQWVVISLGVLLISLSFHESAHAWTAEYFGDPTGRILGRVTLNPIPHIDPIGTLLFPLIGLVAGGVIFGWAKPVPVNSANLRDPKRSNALIAGAGPASNLLLAAGCLVVLRLLPYFGNPSQGFVLESLWLVCQAGLVLNVILAVFNLIPIPPLDGSWILTGLLPDRLGGLMDGIRPYGFLLLLLLLYSGAIGIVLRPVMGFIRILVS